MNRLLSSVARGCFFLALAACMAAGSLRASAAETAAEAEARLKDSITYLASDELEGRGVGTKGLDKAADYIAEQFSQMSLKTDLFDGTPFQKFEVTVSTELGAADKNHLHFNDMADNEPNETTLKLGEDFTPLAVGGSGAFDAPLVFAGYGITAKDLKRGDEAFTYNDYAHVDVKGKVVIILRKEPQQQDEKSPFDGKSPSQHALFMRKIANASEHGAAGVIFVNDGQELNSRREEASKLFTTLLDRLVELRDKFKAATDPAERDKLAEQIGAAADEAAKLSKGLGGSPDALLPFSGAGDETTHKKMPVLFATRGAIDKLLAASKQKDLATLEREIDSDLTPRSLS